MPYGEVRTVRSARRGRPGPPAGYVLGTHYYGDYVTPLIAEGMPLRVAWVAWWGRTFATTLAFGVCDLRPSVGSTACHPQDDSRYRLVRLPDIVLSRLTLRRLAIPSRGANSGYSCCKAYCSIGRTHCMISVVDPHAGGGV